MKRVATNHTGGFTLVELVSCIVILGILTAVAAPNFASFQAFTSRGYADEVANSLRYAQRIAIASGCSVQLHLTAARYDGWLRVNRTINGCNGAWTRRMRRADNSALAGATPAGVNVNPNTVVEFLPNGTVAGGASAAITIGTFTINVDGITGRVSVQ